MLRFQMADFRSIHHRAVEFARGAEGSAILEFAIALPLLVVFVVGIYDFSGAFNQKQKIEQAAQEGAIIAAAQPASDIDDIVDQSQPNPDSLQPVVAAVFNSLAGSGVLVQANQGTCMLSGVSMQSPGPNMTLTYTISGCSGSTDTNHGCMGDTSNMLWIKINRGWIGPPAFAGGTTIVPVGTSVTVSYDYHWRFNSAIQLLIPGARYSAKSCISETSTVLNQS